MTYIKKYFTLALILVIITLFSYQPVQAQMLPLNLIDEVEVVLYGQALDLPIIQRIENIEVTLYNSKGKGSLQERTKEIVNFVLGDDQNPSLLFLVNALEWSLGDRITRGSILVRIEELERIVYGELQDGNLADRINNIAQLTLPDGKVPIQQVNVPVDTVIKLKLLEEVNSSQLNIGEKIDFQVTSDVKINDGLIIPAGTRGQMVATEVENAGQFGKSGQVKLKLASINTIDGTPLTVELFQPEGDEFNRQLAIGASLLGTVILSNPLGLIVGYFVKGKEEVIPVGTQFTVKTTQPEKVFGLKLY